MKDRCVLVEMNSYSTGQLQPIAGRVAADMKIVLTPAELTAEIVDANACQIVLDYLPLESLFICACFFIRNFYFKRCIFACCDWGQYRLVPQCRIQYAAMRK